MILYKWFNLCYLVCKMEPLTVPTYFRAAFLTHEAFRIILALRKLSTMLSTSHGKKPKFCSPCLRHSEVTVTFIKRCLTRVKYSLDLRQEDIPEGLYKTQVASFVQPQTETIQLPLERLVKRGACNMGPNDT